MINVRNQNQLVFGTYRVPFLLSAVITALIYILYLTLASPTIPLATALSVFLALLAAWAVGGLFVFLALKFDNYTLLPTGILLYALTTAASALVIGMRELAAGTSGGAAFLVIAATLSPLLVLVLHALLYPQRFAE